MTEVVCPSCHQGEPVDGEAPMMASIALFVCNFCGFRSVFGNAMPRVVVEPFVDSKGLHWLRRRFQDPITKRDLYVVDLDPQHAAREAVNILSITVGS